MSEDIKKEATQALSELQESIKSVKDYQSSLEVKLDKMGGEEKAKYEKAASDLEKFDAQNQESVLKQAELVKENLDIQERVNNLENITSKASVVSSDYKESPEYKALELLSKSNSFVSSEINPEFQKYLRTDVGTEGGYTVPAPISAEILKKVEEISDVRRLSRVRTITTKTLSIPVRNTIPSATYEGEAEAVGDSNSTYESETMTAHRLTTNIPVTRDLLNFSQFSFEAEIMADAATSFAQKEGNKFLLGTGVKQPLGILDTTSGVATTDSAASGAVSMVDVIQLIGQLKTGYNPVFAFNRLTLAALRSEQDGNGNFLWRIGAEGMPNDIAGFPYVILQDMPDIASSSLSVLFGDFARGYNILDATQMELIRDDLSLKKQAMVEFCWFRWNDGRPVLAEAFKILKTKA